MTKTSKILKYLFCEGGTCAVLQAWRPEGNCRTVCSSDHVGPRDGRKMVALAATSCLQHLPPLSLLVNPDITFPPGQGWPCLVCMPLVSALWRFWQVYL